jgi:hypothetical protein
MITDRRSFIKKSALAALGLGLMNNRVYSMGSEMQVEKGKRIGMLGLDTGHCAGFTRLINAPNAGLTYNGYKVTAAYPKGTENITEWKNKIPAITEDVKKLGVEIVNSMEELLEKTDVVLMTCIDGNRHLELSLPVFQAGKPLFIDKPFAGSLFDAFAIAEAAKKYNVPLFSTSSLRYLDGIENITEKIGKVTGADVYSPCSIEKHHPDLFWYGVHGVETLFAIMGAGCKSVKRTYTEKMDYVVGVWEDNRIGTFRGIREGKMSYGGTAYGEKGIKYLDNYLGDKPLLVKVTEFYDSGITPVPIDETLEIFAFMEAAEESKRKGGIEIDMKALMKKRNKKQKNIK